MAIASGSTSGTAYLSATRGSLRRAVHAFSSRRGPDPALSLSQTTGSARTLGCGQTWTSDGPTGGCGWNLQDALADTSIDTTTAISTDASNLWPKTSTSRATVTIPYEDLRRFDGSSSGAGCPSTRSSPPDPTPVELIRRGPTSPARRRHRPGCCLSGAHCPLSARSGPVEMAGPASHLRWNPRFSQEAEPVLPANGCRHGSTGLAAMRLACGLCSRPCAARNSCACTTKPAPLDSSAIHSGATS